MPRALKVCSTTGCPELVPTGRCAGCTRDAERKRGSSTARGYGTAWSRRSRSFVRRHPFCAVQAPGCAGVATLADHHPISRRDLVDQGVPDPDADHRLRPSCHHCHSVETARHQPGGWAAHHTM